MDEIVQLAGWLCLGSVGVGLVSGALAFIILLVERFRPQRPPQIAGADLSTVAAGLDLSKRYDLAYGSEHGYHAGVPCEKFTGVRILGYLSGQRDATTGEYADGRWLVVELPDGRRAFLRPRSVLWLVEATYTE